MMKKRASIFILSVVLTFGCTVPQYIWPQRDMGFYAFNSVNLEKKLLIASRNSDFKSAIVQRVVDAYRKQPVYIKIIGINDLHLEDATRYSAVLVINTSMGWKIDRKVASYLDKYGALNSIVVLTTSAGGDILPDTRYRGIDAIASASRKENIESVADDIIVKINRLIADRQS